MRRAIALLILLAGAVALALFLADLGGSLEIRVGDYWIGLPFWAALMLLIVGFVLGHGTLTGLAKIRDWPERRRGRRTDRRRADGDAAVTRALIALAAGTADTARLEVRRARGLLGDTPQTLLLAAEAERLGGREEAATEAFRALALRDDARFLGLRGLLRQAMQRQDWSAAQRLAREAEAAQPGAAWLREERQRLALHTRDWREALALAGPEAPVAALAMAAARQEEDAEKAAELERRAFQADHAFTPAAIAHAQRLADAGSARKARGVLEQAWAAAPHPDIGKAWLASVEDKLARVKAVEDLTHRDRAAPEARLLMARAALEAGLTGRARAELEALTRSTAADRRCYLLLAELEQVEHGDTPEGRSAQSRWLREAAGAAPEPRWRCAACGAEHNEWKPECGNCGTAGRIAWGAQGSAAVAAVA